MFNVVLSAVTVSIGLTFWWALTAIAAGTLIGALLIALHATQGPRLGVPQSIQSRGQFGFYGSAFMFPAVLLLNVGFIAAELVIQAHAMNGVTSALSIPQWIVILAIPSVVIGIFGYRWIHWVMVGSQFSGIPCPFAVPDGEQREAAGPGGQPAERGPRVSAPVIHPGAQVLAAAGADPALVVSQCADPDTGQGTGDGLVHPDPEHPPSREARVGVSV